MQGMTRYWIRGAFGAGQGLSPKRRTYINFRLPDRVSVFQVNILEDMHAFSVGKNRYNHR